MAGGWTVRVIMKTLGGGMSERLFHAAVPDRAAAEEAVRRFDQIVTSDVVVEAVGPLTDAELLERGMRLGEVRHWMPR
jgi:hypothetical protein